MTQYFQPAGPLHPHELRASHDRIHECYLSNKIVLVLICLLYTQPSIKVYQMGDFEPSLPNCIRGVNLIQICPPTLAPLLSVTADSNVAKVGG